MMTKKISAPSKQLRFLLVLPLACSFLWCCAQNRERVAVDVKGRYAMRHDIHLGYNNSSEEPVLVRNNASKETVSVLFDPVPTTLNSKVVLDHKALSVAPRCISPGSEFSLRYLIARSGADEILKKMVDGQYHMIISDIIIDPAGKIQYYMLTFPENMKEMTKDPSGFMLLKPNGLTDADKDAIQEKLASVAIGGSVKFTAGKDKTGKDVPAFIKWEDEWRPKLEAVMVVKDHTITYLN